MDLRIESMDTLNRCSNVKEVIHMSSGIQLISNQPLDLNWKVGQFLLSA